MISLEYWLAQSSHIFKFGDQPLIKFNDKLRILVGSNKSYFQGRRPTPPTPGNIWTFKDRVTI